MRISIRRIGRPTPLISGVGLFLLMLGAAQAQWTPTADLPGGKIYTLFAGGGSLFVEAYEDDSGDVDGGIFRSIDNGATWTSADSGLPRSETIHSPVFCGGRIFAGTWERGGFRSSDLGASWTPIDIGTTLPDPIRFLPFGGSRLYAIKRDASVILRSVDCGDSWFFQNPYWPWSTKGTIDAIAMSGDRLIAGALPGFGPVGEVYRSSDNGANWSVANTGLPPHPQVQSMVVTDAHVLAVVTNNGVFRSSDHGLNWSEANTGLATPVSCLAKAGVHLYAGSSSGVFHSSDEGLTWEHVGTGLPGVIRVETMVATETHLFLGTLDGKVWKRPLEEISSPIRRPAKSAKDWGFEGNPGAILRHGTSIPFSIRHAGEVKIGLYDMKGVEVRKLLRSDLEAGRHRFILDAGGLSGGIYHLRLWSSGFIRSRRVVLEI